MFSLTLLDQHVVYQNFLFALNQTCKLTNPSRLASSQTQNTTNSMRGK